jgi:putative phage-type endonuclease
MSVITWEEQDSFVTKEIVVNTLEEQERIQSYEQRSPEWFKAREGRLTGSIIGSVVGHNFFCKQPDLLKELLWSSFEGNEATRYGTMKEAVAFDIYQQYNKENKVWNTGLVVHLEKPWFAYSPDGVLDKGLLEIKSPFKKKFYGKIPQMYYDQISYGMWLLQKSYCDFVVYTPDKTSVETFQYNDDYVEEFLIPRLENFYFRKFLPLFLGKRKGWVDKDSIIFNRNVIVEPYNPSHFKEFVE